MYVFRCVVVEFRKLIKSGQTSFTISLPIDWVKRHKLRKQDIVAVQEEGDLLIIKPHASKAEEQNSQVIEAETLPPGTLGLELFKAYISGATVIWLHAKGIERLQEKLRNIMPLFPGLELEEFADKKIAYRNYFDVQSVTYAHLLQKQKLIVTTLLREIESLLSNPLQMNLLTLANFIDGTYRQNTLIVAKAMRMTSITKSEMSYVLMSNQLLDIARAVKEFLTSAKYLGSDVVQGLLSQFSMLRQNIEAFIVGEKYDHFLLIQSQTEHCKALARQSEDGNEALVYGALSNIGSAAEQYAKIAIIYR
jgi:hypothetical protein